MFVVIGVGMGYDANEMSGNVSAIMSQIGGFIQGFNWDGIGKFAGWVSGSITAIVVLGYTIELAITYQQQFLMVMMEVFNIPAYAWNWTTDTTSAIISAIWLGLADFNC